MAETYQKQLDEPEARGLNFDQRFGMLVDSHWMWCENQALARRRSLPPTTITPSCCIPARAFPAPCGPCLIASSGGGA
jgi:hypothetical protein